MAASYMIEKRIFFRPRNALVPLHKAHSKGVHVEHGAEEHAKFFPKPMPECPLESIKRWDVLPESRQHVENKAVIEFYVVTY